MKKAISVVVAVGIVGILLAVLFRRWEIAAPPAAINTPQATGSPAAGPAPSAVAFWAGSLFGDRKSPASIPIVDRTNPAYATMIRALDGFFLAIIQSDLRQRSLTPAGIEGVARLLSTVRLSQMMHEATLATVTKSTAQSVTISIPAYEAEGQSLQRYLADHLEPGSVSPALNWELTKLFDHFGKYHQELEVRPDGEFQGETVYQIDHATDIWPVGGLKTGSTLTTSLLGGYGVFQPLFPKPATR